MTTSEQSIPERLIRLRALKRWSQAKLADQMGAHSVTVARWEAGKKMSKRYRMMLRLLEEEANDH